MSEQKKTVFQSRVEVWTDVGIPDERAGMFWFVTVGPGELGYTNGHGGTLQEALRDAANNMDKGAGLLESQRVMVTERLRQK